MFSSLLRRQSPRAPYGAQHKGFVVGYNTADPVFSENGAILSKVIYNNVPIVISDLANPPIEAALTKSKAWEYENEWRCVRTFRDDESRDVICADEAISEIILGAAMEDHHV